VTAAKELAWWIVIKYLLYFHSIIEMSVSTCCECCVSAARINMSGFFSQNTEVIKNHIRFIESRPWNEEGETRFRKYGPLLKEILSEPAYYDECSIFIKNVGEMFLFILRNDPTEESVVKLNVFCARLAYEVVLLSGGRVSKQSNDVLSWFTPTNPEINQDEWETMSIVWPLIQRDVVLVDSTARLNEIKNAIISVDKKLAFVDDYMVRTEQSLLNAEERLKAYQENAKRVETKFNFAGLYDAFRGLAEKKRIEVDLMRKRARNRAIISVVPFVIPLVFAGFSFQEIHVDTKITDIIRLVSERVAFSVLMTLPLIGILLYFFRLSYTEYKSLSAVLLQLEHRQSICAFIQNYSEFTGQKNKLDKFEALIFGGITPDPGAVPSTFDGIDQFAKMLEAMKK
jgi:hypothetical protein